MIDTQNRLQNYIDGFRFNLGFSGKFFRRGSAEENKGDDALIGKFGWENVDSLLVKLKCQTFKNCDDCIMSVDDI